MYNHSLHLQMSVSCISYLTGQTDLTAVYADNLLLTQGLNQSQSSKFYLHRQKITNLPLQLVEHSKYLS